ncbi:MAG: hypothetical protein QNJ53_07355 [Pleurocapsa sp. MO_192.B19]|nr:hypothetical protein [Pleurocapsa sp. MO_192.B19]
MANTSKTKSLSFSQAIQATQLLMNEMTTNQLSEAEIEQAISSIISTKNGGRGFFVSYLTSDMCLADNPSVGVINGLKSSIEIISELLTKNLAMSSAMIITHTRNNEPNNVEGSQKVYRRTTNLIQQIKSQLVKQELQKLRKAINTRQGHYQNFLERWNYDAEQQQAIQKAINNTLI